MSSDRLGIGVIGKPQVMAYIAEEPLANYVAGCDLSEGACAEAKDKFGIATFSDYRDLISRPGVDVVFVKTPNPVHREPTIAALDAGKHVFCEKPMALTMDECQAMADAAARNGRALQIDLELRSSLIPRRIKEIIDSGEIGDVRRIMFHHYQGAWCHAPGHWRMNPETCGGIFLEKLVHEADLFRWFAGEVAAVQSFSTGNVIPQSPMPDCLQSMFWFESGAMGSMLHTQARSAMNVPPDEFHRHGHELWFDVIGTKGSLKADVWECRIDVYLLQPHEHPGNMVMHAARTEDYSGQGMHRCGHNTPGHFHEFLRRVLAGEPELQRPQDALKTMALVFAAEESVSTSERVAVEVP